jgi:hypothetical protein
VKVGISASSRTPGRPSDAEMMRDEMRVAGWPSRSASILAAEHHFTDYPRPDNLRSWWLAGRTTSCASAPVR